MGIHREGGYSANVEGYIVVDGFRMRLAKSNGTTLVLNQPCDVAIPPRTDAELVIIVDGNKDSKRIVLTKGVNLGQRAVPYEEPVPF